MSNKKKVSLACTKCRNNNYSVPKQVNTERLILKKYCKGCGTHELHKEEK